MRDEDNRALLRAYVALTLAHEAARRCTGAAAPAPCFRAVLNNQGLAISELDALLGRAFAGERGGPALPEAEADCAALLM